MLQVSPQDECREDEPEAAFEDVEPGVDVREPAAGGVVGPPGMGELRHGAPNVAVSMDADSFADTWIKCEQFKNE